MDNKEKKNKSYNKISRILSPRNLTFAGTVIFFLLLLPVLYLTFVNRASGDDYGYGSYTRAAWFSSHSIIAVGKAVWRTILQYYYSWQGTWFSVGLFTLQPEVFNDSAYWIVAPLMLFLWIGSTFYLFKQILVRSLKMDQWSWLLISVVFLIFNIQFVPSTKSSIFWFNGCAHYMIPFAMCQMVAAWLLKYSKEYKISTLLWITVFMALLGGANYQAALFALIVTCYVILASWFLKRDRRICWLLFPVFGELAGLFISMKAPGNKVRAGEGFGFSVLKGIETIAYSFLYGIRDIGTYIQERPLIFVGLLALFLIFLLAFLTGKENIELKYPMWIALMLYCLYSAMQAPAIYAGVEVSRGVLNTNFQIFMLAASGILLIMAAKAAPKLREKWKEETGRKAYGYIALPGMMICLLLLFAFRSNVKDSTSYVCVTYISSGQAADYKKQMDLQTKLLMDENTADVVLPFINDVQGPLMHMPVTDNPEAWTNRVTGEFYGKDSVVAMPRPEWEEIYGVKDK